MDLEAMGNVDLKPLTKILQLERTRQEIDESGIE